MSHIFKEDELVFFPRFGFIKLKDDTKSSYPLVISDDVYIMTFTKCGRTNISDKYPSLLTVEQAAKLGYYPEKKKVKKWKWILKDTIDNSLCISKLFYSDNQVLNKGDFDLLEPIQKIDSTEIEVEE